MGELIQFLDLHSGSLTVLVAAMSMIITLVYVVATIFICRANIRSAEATREQVAEARRQYEEEHRPYISYQIIYERRMFYGMRFTNHGKRVASHVQIDLDKSFVNSIPKETFRVFLNKLRGEEFSLGIGQDYNIYFGAAEFRKNPSKEPICGTISYCDLKTGANYSESFEIDFEKYATIYSINTVDDDLQESMQKREATLNRIAHAIEHLNDESADASEDSASF